MKRLGQICRRARRLAGSGTRRGASFIAVTGIAFLLNAFTVEAAAETLDRLFFSPLERQTLDQAREEGEPPPPPPPGEKPREAPVVDVISFDGKVERSDGSSTVWVNGRAVFTGDRTVEGIRIESSRGTAGEARFQLPSSGSNTGDGKAPPPFSLKVGEKVSVQNGRKFEAYERRPEEDAESVFELAPAGEETSRDAREKLSEPAGGAGIPETTKEN